jgi:hypothetical protein
MLLRLHSSKANQKQASILQAAVLSNSLEHLLDPYTMGIRFLFFCCALRESAVVS